MIFLDNASTTKPYQKVIDTVAGVMQKYWANPSSNYNIADDARVFIENVREQFAKDLNCSPDEIVFTSGGCESNSLAISGFLSANSGYDFYYSNLEHTSINELANGLYRNVGRVKIPNDSYGNVTQDILRSCIIRRPLYSNRKPFVSISAANSEIGTIQDIKGLVKIVHKYNGIFHCDAVQLFPERRIDVKDLDVDMLSISAQKFHGPRCGILYVKNGIMIDPIIYGSQEGHIRGGTYNTPMICGMGKALELTREHNATEKVRELRNKLLNQLLLIPGTHLNGPSVWKNRLANNISLTIDGVNAEELVTMCDLHELYLSKGSACNSHNPEPSNTLKAIGLTDEQAFNTIRITLDEFNTESEVDQTAQIIVSLINRIREE